MSLPANPWTTTARSIRSFDNVSFNKLKPALENAARRAGAKAPGVIVDAILINTARESGGSFSPLQREVGQPAGRGGFGLSQWTGLRQVTYLAYCRKYGLDPYAADTQVAFLILEYFNPGHEDTLYKGKTTTWSRKTDLKKFLAMTDVRVASDFVVTNFLRPRDSRSPNYRANAFSAGLAKLPSQYEVASYDAPAKGGVSQTEIRRFQLAASGLTGIPLKPDGLWGPKTAAVASKVGVKTSHHIDPWFRVVRSAYASVDFA